MQLYTWLIEPFAEFDFMRYALASVVFLALSAAPMGVFLMMRRMSLVGDALGQKRDLHFGRAGVAFVEGEFFDGFRLGHGFLSPFFSFP